MQIWKGFAIFYEIFSYFRGIVKKEYLVIIMG